MKSAQVFFHVLPILLINCLSACSEQQDWSIINGEKVPEYLAYVGNPDGTDSTCIHAIAKAKKDIADGKVVVSEYLSLGSRIMRYENELAILCKERGLRFEYEALSCLSYEGQTAGCYTAYMNRYLMETYGNDFRRNLEKQADNLLLERLINSDKIIPSWQCDRSPELVDDNGESIRFKPLIITDQRLIPYLNSEENPFITLNLNIDKEGNVQKVFLKEYAIYPKDLRVHKQLLLTKAREHLGSSEVYWLPAEVYAVPVNSEHTVRLPIKVD